MLNKNIWSINSMIFVKTNGNNETFSRLRENFQNMFQWNERKKAFDNMHEVVLLYYNNNAVGCGSYKYYDDITAEFENIYLESSIKNLNTLQQLLFRLEDNAKHAGYQYALFATSKYLINDIQIFKDMNYEIIENYGYYEQIVNAVCLRKKLD